MTDAPRFLSPAAIAKQLDISPDTVLAWIARGALSAINASRDPRSRKPRWRVSPDDLEAFLGTRRNKPAPVRAAPRPRRGERAYKFF